MTSGTTGDGRTGEGAPAAPVEYIRTDDPAAEPEAGVALCLSGGGYRAMLFHVGALWRLNELSMLPELSRVSSVSGGSITAAQLGLRWSRLGFDDAGRAARFVDEVVEPIRRLASRTIDRSSIVRGLLWFGSIGERVASAYAKELYGEATLQDLPADEDGPRFVINATNLQSGALWRFSRPYMADYRVGRVDHPRTSLALAVAASSAFPPFLSPVRVRVDPSDCRDMDGTDLHREPFTSGPVLSDGGVYDNLGLETAWKRYRTVLVSDGGGHLAAEPSPKGDWARGSKRVVDVVNEQVRSLRKRQLIASYQSGERLGTYWSTRSEVADYVRGASVPGVLPATPAETRPLAEEPTRLASIDAAQQERLINWGYAITDVAIRRWVDPTKPPPQSFPYSRGLQ